MFDFSSYLRRIGSALNLDVSRVCLQRIAFAHACAIPFENLDAFCGRPISLEPQQIESKLVHNRRGGYCFEQNALLAGVLQQVGFSVALLSARVWYSTTPNETPPRTHLFLVVKLDEQPWLVDCGLGGSTPEGLMRLDLSGTVQTVGGELRRLVPVADRLIPTYMQQVQHSGHWVDVYEFTGESMPRIDQEMGNWWASTHPESKFRRNLIVAILNSDGSRCRLMNREFVHRRGATVLHQETVKDAKRLEQILEEFFGIQFDDVSELYHRVEHAVGLNIASG